MTDDQPKRHPRSQGRLSQCNKVCRLQRRALNQWAPQIPKPKRLVSNLSGLIYSQP